MANENIKCSVESCKYHDKECNLCKLNSIQVGCNSDCDLEDCDSEDDTACKSFEAKEEK